MPPPPRAPQPPQPAPHAPVAVSPDAWTTRRLLGWITDALTRNQIDSPRLSAEILLSHVLLCERLKLYMDPDREADPLQLERLRSLVGRALRHEPIQYLTGDTWFFGLPFFVDSRVLVPRPGTETIVEDVLQTIRRERQAVATVEGSTAPTAELLIADVCTGSGCIAVALAKNLAQARLIASDISQDALDVARANAGHHHVADRIEFRAGDLLTPLADLEGRFDILVANPPYIPDAEWPEVPENVRGYEPTGALRGGPDGLQFVGPLIQQGGRLLKPGGRILIEIAAVTAPAVLQLAESAGFTETRMLKDLEGHDRVLTARVQR